MVYCLYPDEFSGLAPFPLPRKIGAKFKVELADAQVEILHTVPLVRH